MHFPFFKINLRILDVGDRLHVKKNKAILGGVYFPVYGGVDMLTFWPVLAYFGEASSAKLHIMLMYYSGTSLNGPSEMRTTSVQRTARKAPFDFSMRLVHF